MRAIGGFFGLEPKGGKGSPHTEGIALSTGRACLRTILREARPVRVLVPYYICDSLLDPILQEHMACVYYPLCDDLSPQLPDVRAGDLVVVVNYFGLLSARLQPLVERLGASLVIDNSQAFYQPPHRACWNFYSARKFFGVPDGAWLYPPANCVHTVRASVTDLSCATPSIAHLELKYSNPVAAFAAYRANEAAFTSEIVGMSAMTQEILSSIDCDRAAQGRITNFQFLHELLGGVNTVAFDLRQGHVPFCYPLLLDRIVARDRFWAQFIYPPTLWPRQSCLIDHGFDFEKELVHKLIPLPCDQRYNREDMSRVADVALRILGSQHDEV